ncbi:Ubiquinone biosynthesis O-methyltransferase [Sphingomonas antarctica]|uniref:class I SAM-dependent methyltransferase n=1 Tax=Sphingomonas antarctica TaxID=2040274 RepID=UPI0039ED0697
MDRVIYDRMAEHDSTHWWYRARRDVLASVIAREIKLPMEARILEIGCGTGHNLPMLAQFGTVDAVEIDDAARGVAERRLGRAVASAPLPEMAGVPEATYDMVALLDVLEHVEDDVAALRAIARRLKPGGAILLTVPQYPWMWSGHDVANHHHRRYVKATLKDAIGRAALTLELLSSFNSLLFPFAAAQRVAARIAGKQGSDDSLPPRPVNALFEKLFGLERYLVGRVPMPPGVSLLAVVRAQSSSPRRRPGPL